MKIIITLLLTLFALSSCVKEPEYSGDELEARSLKAWIKKNRPELVGNYQEKGGYYVDVLSWGDSEATATSENDFGGKPIMEQDTCWVFYNFTGYDLDGNVCATRNEVIARMHHKMRILPVVTLVGILTLIGATIAFYGDSAIFNNSLNFCKLQMVTCLPPHPGFC